jgi:lipopolysaccharide export system protein LptA
LRILVKIQRNRSIYLAGIFMVLGLFGAGMGIHAAPKADVIRIKSDRLEASQQTRQVTFLGNVVATQGDLTIKGDRMTIYYLEGGATEGSNNLAARVDRAVVEGNVRISQKDTVVTAKHAVYYLLGNKIVLTGEPRVQRDSDFIQGSSITYFLDSQKSIVEGGPSGPVEATIYSSETGGSFDKFSVESAGGSGTDKGEGG